MPTKKCVKYGSKLYCYEKSENVVYVYPEQKYDINEVPQRVLAAFIRDEYDVKIEIEEQHDTIPLTQDEITLLEKSKG